MQTSTTKTKLGLRVVSPGEINEVLAVDRAQMHAQNHAFTWKQYVCDMDMFLGFELDFDNTVGGFR